MNLVETVSWYLTTRETRKNAEAHQEALWRLLYAFAECPDALEIKAALELDTEWWIPLPLRRLAWEKILAIGERTPEILRGCAFEYKLFWRGAHEVAKQLREEADRMEAT